MTMHPFLTFCHVAEPLRLRSLCAEKWFDTHDVTNFTVANFLAKRHIVDNSQKNHLFPRYLRKHCLPLPRFMIISEEQNKDV